MKILTFDIEEWFHILDHPIAKKENEWLNYESRIHKNMDRIFEFLENFNLRATFFVVGWIAENYPDIIKKIDKSGHEIGSHTHMHQLLYEQSKNQVRIDINKSIDILESLTGKKVKSFRAPGFSITEKNKWVFQILAENQITYDSSIFPAGRAHGGFSNFLSDKPTLVDFQGYKIKEFPINTISFLSKKWIFSGGGYFRLTPYYFIKKWTNSSDYIMTYFHPRDFDSNQPVITDLSILRKFKFYVGINSCMNKLENWVSDFSFTDIREADKNINWNNANVVRL